MALGVVDFLEVVQVEYQDRSRYAVARERFVMKRQVMLQLAPVEQAGELIGVAQLPQLDLKVVTLGNIARDPEHHLFAIHHKIQGLNASFKPDRLLGSVIGQAFHIVIAQLVLFDQQISRGQRSVYLLEKPVRLFGLDQR